MLGYIDSIKNYIGKNHINDDVVNEAAFGYSEIKEYLEKNGVKNVLEIGSGTGLLINYLAENYKQINFEGIEPHKAGHNRFIDTLNQINRVKIYKDEIQNFDPKKKYDLVFSVNVLEHINDWSKYIDVTKDILNDGGLSIVLCPNYEFPYESHYIIPIIINKGITKKLFKNTIMQYEIKNNALGHYDALNFIKKKQLIKYLNMLRVSYEFDDNIKYRMLERLYNDKALLKRQKVIGKISYILLKIKIHKIILDIFKVPFPYMKLIYTKNKLNSLSINKK